MQKKLLIAGALVGGVLMFSGSLSSIVTATTSKIFSQPKTFQAQEPIRTISDIVVDVSGAVNNPGVYSFSSGSRMKDVLQKAGGVSTQADSEYIAKSMNLSQKVTDGMKIYIPLRGESGSVGGDIPLIQSPNDGMVDLNSATVDQLDKLPGVGPTIAQSIIAKRPYTSIDQLVSKKVISKTVFTKIQKLVTVR